MVDRNQNKDNEEYNGDEIHDILLFWKKAKKYVYSGAAVAFGLVAAINSYYSVPTGSVGLIERFGKYTEQVSEGAGFKIPFIESINMVDVSQIRKVELGFRTAEAGENSKYIEKEKLERGEVSRGNIEKIITGSGERVDTNNLTNEAKRILYEEYITLTGDLNIADVEATIQWKPKDAVKFFYNNKDVEYTIRDGGLHVLKQIHGDGSVDEAVTLSRQEDSSKAVKQLQDLLDNYESGIFITGITFGDNNPPLRVRPFFNDVNKAMSEKKERLTKSKTEYNAVVPSADGEAKAMIENARGYSAEVINRAEGDIARFNFVYEQYLKSKEITEQKMLLETMKLIIQNNPSITIVDSGIGKQTLPLLNLREKSGLIKEINK